MVMLLTDPTIVSLVWTAVKLTIPDLVVDAPLWLADHERLHYHFVSGKNDRPETETECVSWVRYCKRIIYLHCDTSNTLSA